MWGANKTATSAAAGQPLMRTHFLKSWRVATGLGNRGPVDNQHKCAYSVLVTQHLPAIGHSRGEPVPRHDAVNAHSVAFASRYVRLASHPRLILKLRPKLKETERYKKLHIWGTLLLNG